MTRKPNTFKHRLPVNTWLMDMHEYMRSAREAKAYSLPVYKHWVKLARKAHAFYLRDVRRLEAVACEMCAKRWAAQIHPSGQKICKTCYIGAYKTPSECAYYRRAY